jgi:hypothetical protein
MGKIANKAKTICKYHIHGCQHYIKCQKNAVKFNTHNDIEHELAKAKICYELQKMGHEFITEACRNDTGDIIDIVDLTDGSEVEVDWKHGNISELQKRGVIIYKVEKVKA